MLTNDRTTSPIEEHLPSLRVRLLGTPHIVHSPSQRETRLPAQTMLLFAMLTTRKHELLDREEVAFTLWPDCGESEARAALRRHLHRLHQALPPQSARPWIVCDTQTISWGPSDETFVDVAEFERFSETPRTFDQAAKLYVGDFLPRLDHEWVSGLRERLRRRIVRVLELLIAQCRAKGDRSSALEYVEQLLGHDPWREDAVRDLLLLRFNAGDRAGALAYYRRFAQRLGLEFGVEPLPETVKCFESITKGSPVFSYNGAAAQ
jgi:DNA-binding SARP family transcriptional activator